MENITYGKGIFKNIEFGLYGWDDLEFKESKEAILDAFNDEFKDTIKAKLKNVGLEFISLEYYSPKFYNFESDNIDLTLKVVDKNVLRKAIIKHKDEINKRLQANKSYDGYLATTIGSVESELSDLNKYGYEPDIIVYLNY